MMQVKCPTCRREITYDVKNPWRPFCSERCKLIDLGEWASGSYRIQGTPGAADPDLIVEALEKFEQQEQSSDEEQRY